MTDIIAEIQCWQKSRSLSKWHKQHIFYSVCIDAEHKIYLCHGDDVVINTFGVVIIYLFNHILTLVRGLYKTKKMRQFDTLFNKGF